MTGGSRDFHKVLPIRPPLSTMYDLGLWSVLMTVVHRFSLSSLTLTQSPGWSAGSSLVPFPLSRDSFYLFFALTSAFLTAAWSGSFGFETSAIVGTVALICLPMISPGGVFPVAVTGIARP